MQAGPGGRRVVGRIYQVVLFHPAWQALHGVELRQGISPRGTPWGNLPHLLGAGLAPGPSKVTGPGLVELLWAGPGEGLPGKRPSSRGLPVPAILTPEAPRAPPTASKAWWDSALQTLT